MNSFSTSSAKFSEFDAGNLILFQINFFGRTIKDTTLARHLLQVPARLSLTRLRDVRQINRTH